MVIPKVKPTDENYKTNKDNKCYLSVIYFSIVLLLTDVFN
jgi:hypothetical protein